jgi:alpha-beta hydrolase superfamily lysophospholipase
MPSLALALLLTLGPGPSPITESISLRGRAIPLHLYGARGGPAAIVASGDGGWVHLGPQVAEMLAARGYFVVGLDSKAYLSAFTSSTSALAVTDVPGDLAALVGEAARGAAGRPLLVGVSEGASLAVLAAGDDGLKARVAGVIALGLPDQAELGWRLRDSLIYLTHGLPDEPLFSTADVAARVSPLPLCAVHSIHDEFVPLDEVQRVMARAQEPKKLVLIDAANHRFGGKEGELEQRVLEAIEWIRSRGR